MSRPRSGSCRIGAVEAAATHQVVCTVARFAPCLRPRHNLQGSRDPVRGRVHVGKLRAGGSDRQGYVATDNRRDDREDAGPTSSGCRMSARGRGAKVTAFPSRTCHGPARGNANMTELKNRVRTTLVTEREDSAFHLEIVRRLKRRREPASEPRALFPVKNNNQRGTIQPRG